MMTKYKGINLTKSDIKLIKKLKKMKKDKKKAKRKYVKKTKKQEPQETFFGKNRIGGGAGSGFTSGQTHTNTIVVPNQTPQTQQTQNNQQTELKFKENESRIKLLENKASDLLNFKDSLTIIPQKAKGPITRRKATLIDEDTYMPTTKPFTNPTEQYYKQQNTNSLNDKTQYITEPVMKSSVDYTDNIGGATFNNSSDKFIEEAPDVFGAEDIPQDIPQDAPQDIPQDAPAQDDIIAQMDAELAQLDEEEKTPKNINTIPYLISQMNPKQRAKYKSNAEKFGLSTEEYLVVKAIEKKYSGDYTGVKAYLENKGKK